MKTRANMPYLRKIGRASDNSKRGWVYAGKLLRRSARTESEGEGRHIMGQQLRREVESMEDQPTPLDYLFDDRFCRAQADLKVWLRDGTIEVHEVKFHTQRTDPELNRRLDAIEIAYADLGITYRRFFSDEFARQPRRTNIDLAYRYCGEPGAENFLVPARDALEAQPGLTFAELSRLTGITMPCFLALVYDNHLGIDLDAPIGPEMIVLP
jgi:hypothetical protein